MVSAGLLLIVGGLAFLYFKKPAQRPPSAEVIERTPARLQRGNYLVEGPFGCLGCHSQFDENVYSMPPKPGTEGGGGFCFNERNVGFPGQVCAQNITPDPEAGIGNWTDGEVMRAIREGVAKDGHALFPMMPYAEFHALSDEDTRSIVAYLRTLRPLRGAPPPAFLKFPVSLLVKFEPKPLEGPVPQPDPHDSIATGQYYARACEGCHTPVDKTMHPIAGRAFSGGREFHFPGLTIVSPNITFDETGLGGKSREQFVAMFKSFAEQPLPRTQIGSNTLMPWYALSKMSEPDLGAVYDYLQTVPRIRNQVQRRPTTALPQ